MEKGDQLVRLNAGHKGAAGILFKHDLVGERLAVKFHQIKCPVGHECVPPLERARRGFEGPAVA